MTNAWCILRTSARYTIPLAETLKADGYEVWTPVETRMVRVPRKNVKREVRLPIMPSYVFARSDRLVDLLMLADEPVKPRRAGTGAHSDFSVMHAFGGIPLVPDAHLTKLREREDELTPKPKTVKAKVPTFDIGELLRMGSGIFAGMVGRVERSDEANTLLTFGTRAVKFPTLLLRRNDGIIQLDALKAS